MHGTAPIARSQWGARAQPLRAAAGPLRHRTGVPHATAASAGRSGTRRRSPQSAPQPQAAAYTPPERARLLALGDLPSTAWPRCAPLTAAHRPMLLSRSWLRESSPSTTSPGTGGSLPLPLAGRGDLLPPAVAHSSLPRRRQRRPFMSGAHTAETASKLRWFTYSTKPGVVFALGAGGGP